ncbi:MAG: UDP-N-acetylmuramoyl-L-alanine--D-glutamate ligase, partial [Synergistaceae bacterium]|nr:UDP-N-acetylmuramoyl-L-alanine--D-glutamate ligase [Synergistaceae bacterium]
RENFDAVVLELSSFQLERANILNNYIAIITNLAPDHIDWHGSYENYVKAKAKLINLRAKDGWAIIQDRDVELIKQVLNLSELERVITLSWDKEPENKLAGHIFMNEAEKCAVLSLDNKVVKLFKFSDTDLLGLHNLENAAMSLASLYLMGININNARDLLSNFKPLPHRCHNAGVIDGVLYVDDSKGTNVAASAAAMQSVPGRKIIILGGQGKGEDYAPLAQAVIKYADAAVLLGEEAEAINKALLNAGFNNIYRAKDMGEAVKIAHDIAKANMTVLLSPACTSWDMYSSYNQRGDHFCELVNKLK